MKDILGQDGNVRNEVKDVLTYEGHYYDWPRSFKLTRDGPRYHKYTLITENIETETEIFDSGYQRLRPSKMNILGE